jgi:peptidoglycan/LPS O-acetylase OafA/YrhL
MVLLAAALGVSPSHPQWLDWRELPAQLFLVQAYGVPGGHGWNGPTWTISALMGCYLAFPRLVRLVWRIGPWTALAIGVGAYLAADAVTRRLLDVPVYWTPLQYGFVRALPLFALGVILARVSESVVVPRRIAAWIGLGALAAFVGLQALGAYGLISLALTALMILAAGAIPVTRPSRAIAFGALASFSIYISNEVVRIGYFGLAEQLQRRLDLSVPMQWALWAGGVLCAFAFAGLFYLLFDRPTQAWLNRADPLRRKAVAPGALPAGSPLR